ncbi:trypsin-like serine peptidase [Streptomyces sp. NPDC088785]|uniref:trypsin-like serine peptidase n=1 Tax=Streptomyces sp. NPDC088785 TaxID=3365897 RepID=UPI00382BC3AE
MRPIRPLFVARRARGARGRTRPVAAVVALGAALALTATACGSGDDGADAKPTVSATAGGDKLQIPDDIKRRLKEHGFDLDKWKDGQWKNWDRDKWLREAQDFVNPIIAGLWDTDRMRDADENPGGQVDTSDLSGDQGVTDPEPRPVKAAAVPATYHQNVPYAGKLVFDTPEGQAQCSATVVTDPAHPGRSNMVWTAGHCVHAGKSGGWYRNLAFVPSYNDSDLSGARLQGATREQIAPYGVWWADAALTSDQWIAQGGPTGGAGASYDFAVLHVKPEKGTTDKSLEEMTGSALPVNFSAPAVPKISQLTAKGYPAAPPFDGQKLFQCADRPGRLSLAGTAPTMYRIGCTMTGGSSGGGWIGQGPDGKPALVSNTSIGPVTSGWLAGPRLGKEAKAVYEAVSEKFADQ